MHNAKSCPAAWVPIDLSTLSSCFMLPKHNFDVSFRIFEHLDKNKGIWCEHRSKSTISLCHLSLSNALRVFCDVIGKPVYIKRIHFRAENASVVVYGFSIKSSLCASTFAVTHLNHWRSKVTWSQVGLLNWFTRLTKDTGPFCSFNSWIGARNGPVISSFGWNFDLC